MNPVLTDSAERMLGNSLPTPDGCWVWQGALKQAGRDGKGAGYAETSVGGKRVYVHRLAFYYFWGPIPSGYQVDHLCRNRACLNPLHLEAVTPRENILRGGGMSAIHAVQSHCIHGHPFDAKNTYYRKDTGARQCKTCGLERNRNRKRETLCLN